MSEQGSSHIPLEEIGQRKAQTDEQGRGEKASSPREAQKQPPRLVAGDLCLDFVNTMYPDGFLTNATDLLRWSLDIGLLTAENTQELLVETGALSEESNAVFTQAITLRETSYRVLLALIHHTPPASSDMHTLQSLFMQARSHERLIATDHHLVWQQEQAGSGLKQLYRSFVYASEMLLTSPVMERVKELREAVAGSL